MRRTLAHRELGRSGLSVSTLGFGGGAIGNLYRVVGDDAAQSACAAALDCGIELFDTAPHYGFGLSEKRIGAALANASGRKPVISTKVGRLLQPDPSASAQVSRHGFLSPEPVVSAFDYSYDGVMASHEASLRRLGVSQVDILLAHDLGERTHGQDHGQRQREFLGGGYRAMRKLRDTGAVRAIGLGVNEWQVCESLLDYAEFDCFLLAGRYTLLEQTALDSFLPLCAQRGISVIAGGPFNSGVLATRAQERGQSHYDYAPPPQPVLDRVRRMENLCADFAVELPAAALQFVLAHPQIAAVIPGCASASEVRHCAKWLEEPIPSAFWAALRSAGLLHANAPVPPGALR